MAKIKTNGYNNAVDWCNKYISQQKYCTHTQTGGPGWFVERGKFLETTIHIKDDKQATMLILKHGDKLK